MIVPMCPRAHVPMYRLALWTAAAGFLLIVAGGLVTSTDSGLAVPDWPLSYGTLFPPLVGGIRFEHTHRVIAASVGLLTLLLCLWLLFKESRRWVRWLGIWALGLVVFQGILGGVTVLWGLPAAVSIGHAILGQTFFATLVLLATVLAPSYPPPPTLSPSGGEGKGEGSWLALTTTAAIYLQLILGATLRHVGWLPHLTAVHIGVAFILLALITQTAGRILKNHRGNPTLTRSATLLRWLLLGQLALGFTTWMGGADVWAATAHVAVGALLLATSARLTFLLLQPLKAQGPQLKGSDLLNGQTGKRANGLTSIGTYLELTKPRLTGLAVLSGALGFFLASPAGSLPLAPFLITLLGLTLTGAGAGALNQQIEWEADGKMKRTQGRPIPSGRITPEAALAFGVALGVTGLLTLSLGTNPLAGALAAATLISYLFFYTPLKRHTALCTLIGAIPGALPPMIGWAAATGTLERQAWPLFWILFLWQLPHFLSLAWRFREDYQRAGFKMLPALDPDGRLTFRQAALYALALIPVSLLPAVWGLAGGLYFLAALASGVTFLGLGLATARVRTGAAAHRFFLGSVLYLPFLFATLMIDRWIS